LYLGGNNNGKRSPFKTTGRGGLGKKKIYHEVRIKIKRKGNASVRSIPASSKEESSKKEKPNRGGGFQNTKLPLAVYET